MVFAAMPLAPVYEDGDLCSREHNVRLTTEAGKWPGAGPVTKSSAVQLLTQRELWLRVAARNALHSCAHLWGSRWGGWQTTTHGLLGVIVGVE
jgi:hypothetical protein